MELQCRTFTTEEKKFVKQKILQVSQILRKWCNLIRDKDESIDISQVKFAFLNGKVLVDHPDWFIDQTIIKGFQSKSVPELGEPIEIAVVRSFLGLCKNFVNKITSRVSSQTGLKSNDLYEDLLQDAIGIVLHSMYYYNQEELELSTFIGNSLKNGLNRSIRYDHCVTSPISVEDNTTKIKLIDFIRANPGYTFDQIADHMSVHHDLKDSSKIVELLRGLVRENDKEEKGYSLSNIPCRRNMHEEVDCIDTVEILSNLFSDESKALLNLTDKEFEILKFGASMNFERGWQSRFSEQDKSITRQRAGQVYESAVKKIRPFLAKVHG